MTQALHDSQARYDGQATDAPPDGAAEFHAAVLAGLSAPTPEIPSKYLYDAAGLALYERICALPEYYPCRTELALLRARGADIAALAGPEARVVEFGSGSGAKTRALLGCLDRPAAYVPVDTAPAALAEAQSAMADHAPDLPVAPVRADFLDAFALPPTPGRRSLGFFPGSTIGNLRPLEVEAFLARAARLLGEGGGLLVGVDLKKDPARLHAAYNDAQGVTAAFNLNLLHRLRRDLAAEVDAGAFAHVAPYDPYRGRIEMRLVAARKTSIAVAGRVFNFECGQSVRTEVCYKYEVEEFQAIARLAGMPAAASWVDPDRLFSLHYLAPEA